MKKIFYLASIAALALSSCAKDDTTEVTLGNVASGGKITVAMSGNDTRTYLDANKKFRWEGTDAIAVYNDNDAARMNGTQFKMAEGEESAVAVFTGPALNSKFNHLAYYPWEQGANKHFSTAVWLPEAQVPGKADGVKAQALDLSQITPIIPADQEYIPGTFGNGVVPAISTRFDIAADGSADVTMQPLADYLFVDIMSVEPIETLTLKIKKGTNFVNIAGQIAIEKYLLSDGTIRYYMPQPEEGNKEIVLSTNERSPEVSCHEANTYVFVIPAGILGMGGDETIFAYLYVNDATSYTFAANGTDNDNCANNKQLMYKKKDESKGYVAGNLDWRKDVTADSDLKNKGDLKVYSKPLENTYFYMNDKDADGNVIPFVYNPHDTFIIEHEGHLLKYLTEYGTEPTADGTGIGFVNALICANHTFNFSKDHIKALSDLKDKDNKKVYAEFEKYFAAYLGETTGRFPVIEYTTDGGQISNDYKNKFIGVEYKGKLPEITGIYQPLAGGNGVFGNIIEDGEVNNVSFSGLEAATDKINCIYGTHLPGDDAYGWVLGSMNGGKLTNVTIDNATGLAILNKADNAAYNALTVTNAKNLEFVALDMDLTGDLEIKNWSDVSAVHTDVFGSLMAIDVENDYHHVVKLPATADYSKLSLVVGNDYDADNIQQNIYGHYPFYPVYANQTDPYVVSVLLGDATSVWTGDKFPANYWENNEVAVKTYEKDTDKVNGWPVKDYYKLEYAEQLATGATDQISAVVMRNMDLSYAVNPWEMVQVNHIEGNKKTIKGVHMFRVVNNEGAEVISTSTLAPEASAVTVADHEDYLASGIAPVDAYRVTNLTVDGVKIDIYTPNGNVVPANIGGLALAAEDVQNVTVKNLVITGDGANKNNEEYADNAPVFIGWLVANTRNPYIIDSNVEGVNCEIGGIAGLVGKITLNTTDASHPGVRIEDSAATVTKLNENMASIAKMTEVGQFFDWGKANVAGTSVGYVRNDKGEGTSISLYGSNEPVFLFYAPAKINVLYKSSDTEAVNSRNANYDNAAF